MLGHFPRVTQPGFSDRTKKGVQVYLTTDRCLHLLLEFTQSNNIDKANDIIYQCLRSHLGLSS